MLEYSPSSSSGDRCRRQSRRLEREKREVIAPQWGNLGAYILPGSCRPEEGQGRGRGGRGGTAEPLRGSVGNEREL